MSFEIIGTYLVGICLLIGAGFALVGTIGLLKFNDSMTRLHAPTKATTLGVGGVLIASMIHALLVEHQLSVHELLITIFLFLTAPITANFIAKAHDPDLYAAVDQAFAKAQRQLHDFKEKLKQNNHR